ncbi:MAG: uracil-xanthine permease family protein [Candidatus Euphemobacter frigidus]|nr:uracil-xanthine permease family protein [Candidatus Euphemobacter frigidus]MDP8275476.1 uracil-xanthine permease family protein [Candidatus Euphemobacter frigidus]
MPSPIHSADYRFRLRDGLVGAQMLFVAFGALVLVPLLTGLDPRVALFTAGIGTLIFQAVTRGKVPIFLASSFAFIPPIIYGVKTWGIPPTLCGLAAAGVFYLLLSFFIRWQGSAILHRILPPIVTGPVIMVIGLILAPNAVKMAMGKSGDVGMDPGPAILLAAVALGTSILVTIFGKGLIRLIPILCGIAVGYLVSLIFGLVDFTPVREAPWLAVPGFVCPRWNWEAIIYIVPVAIAPAIEHFGDIVAIGAVTGRDYIRDPGIQNTMLGDGLATTAAAFLGGPPNTTYSEVIGAVALVRIFNPAIMTWGAIFAIGISFVGKLGALLRTIPPPVMGGIMLLLFGAITVVGLNILVRAGKDLMEPRNMVVCSLILVCGIGGMSFKIGGFTLAGIGLAGILGVVLNLVLPGARKESKLR